MPTYGLKVYNGDNQVILNSDEGFPTFIKTGGGTLGTNTGTLIDWPSSIYISDLFFVVSLERCVCTDGRGDA